MNNTNVNYFYHHRHVLHTYLCNLIGVFAEFFFFFSLTATEVKRVAFTFIFNNKEMLFLSHMTLKMHL